MSNVLLNVESKKSLRNELVATPEGRLYMAILNQALLDVIGNTDYYTKKVALDWFVKEENILRDFCLLLAEIDRDYIVEKLKEKLGIKEYEELSGYKRS